MDTLDRLGYNLWTLWTGLDKTYGHFGQAWVQFMDTGQALVKLMDTLDRLGYNLWTLLDSILGKINELCLGSCACKFN